MLKLGSTASAGPAGAGRPTQNTSSCYGPPTKLKVMAGGLLRPGSATSGGGGQPLRRRRGRAAPNGHRRRRRRAASQPNRAGPRSAGSRPGPPRARRRSGGRGARRCRAAIYQLATSRAGPSHQRRDRQTSIPLFSNQMTTFF